MVPWEGFVIFIHTDLISGKSDVKFNVVLGTGQLDWKAILKTARQTKVDAYLIEDESPGAEKQIPQSLKYLGGLSW